MPAVAAALGDAAVRGAHYAAALAAFHVAFQAAAKRRDKAWFDFLDAPRPLLAGERRLARALCGLVAGALDDAPMWRVHGVAHPALFYLPVCLRGAPPPWPGGGGPLLQIGAPDVAGPLLEFLALRSEAAATATAAADARLLPALGAFVSRMRAGSSFDIGMQQPEAANAFGVLHALARAATSEVC